MFTKILSAISLAIARLVLRTHISMGPFIGALRSSLTSVCNVNPRSDNRCTIFVSPLRNLMRPFSQGSRSVIGTMLPSFVLCFRELVAPLHSSQVPTKMVQELIWLPCGHLAGALRILHKAFSVSSEISCSILHASMRLFFIDVESISEKYFQKPMFTFNFNSYYQPFLCESSAFIRRINTRPFFAIC